MDTKKRVISVHGWGGTPDEGWRPWLGVELEKHGITFLNPEMPNTNFPNQDEWVSHLHSVIASPNNDTYLIGHSLGSIAILRYLERLSEKEKVGGIVLVAGFTDDLGLPALTNYFTSPIDWKKIQAAVVGGIVSIESDNDPYNLAMYNDEFKKYVGAKTLLLHDRKHFSGDDGITILPEALEELLALMKPKL